MRGDYSPRREPSFLAPLLTVCATVFFMGAVYCLFQALMAVLP